MFRANTSFATFTPAKFCDNIGIKREVGNMELIELRDRRTEILSAAARHGAYNVRVFGSVARGDDSTNSDIDFLVELEPGRSLFDHVALWQDLEALLGCKVDVVEPESLHWYIRDRVLNEAIAL